MKGGSSFKKHVVQRRKKRKCHGFHVSDDIEMVSEIEVELSVTTVVDVDGGEIHGPSNDLKVFNVNEPPTCAEGF